MLRLTSLMYALAGPTLAGILITAALVMDKFDTKSMIIAAAVGFIAAIPVSWIVAKKIADLS